ncbi:protein containing C-terminal region/beta chain of methionyl-tRNA synthetase [Bernardetia litoralis DSM 6794]|uniref:Methionine--tRNA ligase n=1 Tax=Bernardetia litoralis (strain ATCC 23117 / DSM 6794 / NBRC 15988 / NCIMB 1366 / Fx l1 / Sio-4) TaxID=880071 RepID=I4AIM2_BERLS|nr:methionine--tRNA ligase [Bernardetia litoralis]AFM03807.1 protein containing C-terminal region/beta chain of methionyl-tRNA synthetase [Bernardetia litoralis DSM 6794]
MSTSIKTSQDFKRTTVTAALPYANGGLHIGHIAGAYLPADTYVRYLRMKNHDVVFVSGSDEHGAAITLRAKKEGITPKEIIDKYDTLLKNSFKDFGIEFDIYHRTSSDLHKETAQEFFTTLYNKDVFRKQTNEQFYDEKFEQFLADRYIVGTCPNCQNDNAYGDQCEKCGSTLSPTELINPKSALSGEKPVLKSTSHWFLPLQNYDTWLREWILESKKEEWRAGVYGQCKSWIEQGLHERSMTRDLDWGVPVPLPDADGKVLYVWLDAPIGYVSATKQWAKNQEKEGKGNQEDWKKYWLKQENKADDSRLIHFIGKDNIVFHCLIFPIILKAHGDYILPENVPANNFLNLEGDKISTSREWAVWLNEYVEEFPTKKDELRYVLTSIAPETKDSEFTWATFQSRINNELVDTLGNFVNRTVVLINKYYDGIVPNIDLSIATDLTDFDKETLEGIKTQTEKVSQNLETFNFRDGLFEVMELARIGNKYLATTEPWKLQKTEPQRVEQIMKISAELTANLAILMRPFLPTTSDKIAQMLNITDELKWNVAGNLELVSGKINKAILLFEKIEDELVESQVKKLGDNKARKLKELKEQKEESAEINPIAEIQPEIQFEDFSKIDIRVATIKNAEPVKKADKLLKITLEVGEQEVTVASGIAEHFSPEEIIGKQVCWLANLAPRKMRGIVSQGMILLAENEKGKLVFVSPEKMVNTGAQVK